jgi:hypothetical protein
MLRSLTMYDRIMHEYIHAHVMIRYACTYPITYSMCIYSTLHTHTHTHTRMVVIESSILLMLKPLLNNQYKYDCVNGSSETLENHSQIMMTSLQIPYRWYNIPDGVYTTTSVHA